MRDKDMMSKAGSGWRPWLWLVCSLVIGAGLAPGVFHVDRAQAQSGWWPWATEQEPPRRPPPVRRDPPPTWQAPRPGSYADTSPPGPRGSICLQLEQRLVDFQRGGGQSQQNELPAIENEMRQVDRSVRSSEAQLERSDCYDYFLFSKSLRRTRRCVDLANQAEAGRRRLSELDIQRRQIQGLGQRDRGYQDELIQELARNRCGPQYQQEASRRQHSNNPFSSLWQDEDSQQTGRGNDFRTLPFATYRTVCVRLCDGYYFPISFSTLENHFGRDAEACQSRCAAPAALYFYQNPGGSMDQAVSLSDRRAYTSLKSAFRYRKEFVSGCSCKQAEYTPSPADQGDRKADATSTPNQTQAAQARANRRQ